MIRTIITTDKTDYMLKLPEEFIGKRVEVIAFVIDEDVPQKAKQKTFTVLEIPEGLKKGYKFNREEANRICC